MNAVAPKPNSTAPTTVVVIGGGISGLSAAWELSSSSPPGTRIVVLEASPRLGGNLRSSQVGGRVVDVGADAFLARRPEALELCQELGIGDTLVAPGSQKASVWAKEALRPLPAGLVLGVPTRIGPLARSGIISPLGVARAAIDLVAPFRPDPRSATADRSVGEVVASRLGSEVRDLLAGPLVGGIHAGSADDLSAEAVFPALLEASREKGSLMRALRQPGGPTRAGCGSPDESSPAPTGGAQTGASPVFYSPVSGVSSIPEKLAAVLRARGVEVLTSQPVERVRCAGGPGGADFRAWSVSGPSTDIAADALVMALPAKAAAGLLGEVDPGFAELVGGVPSASVVLVTLQIDAASLSGPLGGTGFLVPAAGGGLVTACTFLSTKWPHLKREGDVLIRASAGRAGDDRALSMADDELVRSVRAELEKMIGPFGEPREVIVTRYEDAFPQYLVGHTARVSAIEAAAARLPAFSLAGATYHGIGIPACIGSGRRAARLVLAALSKQGGATGHSRGVT